VLRILILLLALVTPTVPAAADAANGERANGERVVILIGIDGFRPDYLERGATPNLSRLAQTGVTGPMRPSFPTKTFPNHWTLVTGLVPDRHGIVANRMEDPSRPDQIFTMASEDPFWWNAAEPIWVAAERAGIRTATMFWPGSNVGWGGLRKRPNDMTEGGTRPADWQQFHQAITNAQRVGAVLDWLRRPAAIRPKLVTLYFDTVDTAGHEFGPDDPRTTAAIAEADGHIGSLLAGLAELQVEADLVIVADHGMVATSSDRVIPLDQLADPALYRIIESGPYAGLEPTPGNAERLWQALAQGGKNHSCWRKADLPRHLDYGASPRIPAILCLARSGWLITPSAPERPFSGGSHGYDHTDPAMAALFIANGPSFASGTRLPAFGNTAVTPLLRQLLGLPPKDGLDGTVQPFAKALRP